MKDVKDRIYFLCILVVLFSFAYSPITNVNDNVILGKWLFSAFVLCLFFLFVDLRSLSLELIALSCLLVNSIVCIHGFLQFLDVVQRSNSLFPYCASFDNPAGLLGLITVLFPFGCYYCILKKKAFCLLLLLINLLTAILIGSRSLVAVLFVQSYFGALCFNKNFKLLWLGAPCFLLLCFCLAFFFKADSTSGRMLIIKTCFEMIKDKPLFGFGFNGFSKCYMDYQADFLKQVELSHCQLLADNINNPLNEYLLATIEFGVSGLSIILFVLVYIMVVLWKRNSIQSLLAITVLSGICVSSLFSYPLRYPSTYLGFCYIAWVFCCDTPRLQFFNGVLIKVLSFVIIVIVSGTYYVQRKWYVASHSDDYQSCIRQYQSILPVMRWSYKFLYNYSYTLYMADLFDDAKSLALQSDFHKKDYNTILLLGKIHEKQGDYVNADSLYSRAHYMCPSKFYPLYSSFLLSKDYNPSRARELAKEIIEKEIKIPSDQIFNIRFAARQYLYGKNN